MIGLTLVGCAMGAAVFALVALLRPPAPDPLVLLARFDAAQLSPPYGPPMLPDASSAAGIETRLGRWLATELARRGIGLRSLRQDLALTGQRFEAAMGRKVLLGCGGFVLGLLIAILLGTVGLPLPPGAPVVVSALFAVGFFLLPDVDARSAAHKRRAEFRRALGAYLDWVSLQMSGRAAAEQALPDAAKLGGGWPLALIRHTVAAAIRSGQDVWVALGELGERIGVAQLRELGALVQLVAHDGAQVRDTLTARAASLRNEELADAEGTAGKRDQSMLLAQILLGVGFAVFLGYPAVVNFLRI